MDRKHVLTDAAIFFLIALLTTLIVFIVMNENRHKQISKAEKLSCKQSAQIAANQERVIKTLIRIEEEEKTHDDITELENLLARVPEFKC